MIIALCGRKGSGKSELVKVCVEKGYTVLKFADGLKDLVSSLLNMSREELEEKKTLEIKFCFNQEQINFMEAFTKIPKIFFLPLIKDKIFTTPREMLQYIGTEIIRAYNPNWHTDLLISKIEEGKNYVIDDMRFPFERSILKKFNPIEFFLIRPNNFEYDNHESETSLKWNNFKRGEHIVNNLELQTLIKKWEKFLYHLENDVFNVSGFSSKKLFREFLIDQLEKFTTKTLSNILNCSTGKIVWWCQNLMVRVTEERYKYNEEAFLNSTSTDCYLAGLLTADGCVKYNGKNGATISFTSTDLSLVNKFRKHICPTKPIYLRKGKLRNFPDGLYEGRDSYDFEFSSPYVIENLKHWNIKPKKSVKEDIPDILKENIEGLKQWIVGLIDGDGSVFLDSKGDLTILITSSENVIDYLKEIIPVKVNKVYAKSGLYSLRFWNFKALELYHWLEPKEFLDRKWLNVKKFTKPIDN